MREKRFQKKIEDFECENCGAQINGTGYTDHCPYCFYSKHVDINPGDRKEDCGGLMKVISIENKDGKYVLMYECDKCGYIRKNKVHEDDDMGALIQIQKALMDEFAKK